jgi:hypothetical protein
VVGSLLRPPYLKEARGRLGAGELSAAAKLRLVAETAREVWGPA